MHERRGSNFVLAGSRGERFGAPYTVMTFNLSGWPGGLEPVWTLLDAHSAEALSAPPSAGNRALRLLLEQAGLIRPGGLWFECTARRASGAAVPSRVLGP